MSDINLPQKDSPWTNHEYFWYELTEFEFGDDQSKVKSVIALQHNNDTGLVREWRFDRNMLIDRIKAGDRFMYQGECLAAVCVGGVDYVCAGKGPLIEF